MRKEDYITEHVKSAVFKISTSLYNTVALQDVEKYKSNIIDVVDCLSSRTDGTVPFRFSTEISKSNTDAKCIWYVQYNGIIALKEPYFFVYARHEVPDDHEFFTNPKNVLCESLFDALAKAVAQYCEDIHATPTTPNG
jgi:hypothetical protein